MPADASPTTLHQQAEAIRAWYRRLPPAGRWPLVALWLVVLAACAGAAIHLLLGRFDWTMLIGPAIGAFVGQGLARRDFTRRHGGLVARRDFEDAVRTGRPPPWAHLPTWAAVVDRERQVQRRGSVLATVLGVGMLALVGWMATRIDVPTEISVRLLAVCAVAMAVCVLSARRRSRQVDRLAVALRPPPGPPSGWPDGPPVPPGG